MVVAYRRYRFVRPGHSATHVATWRDEGYSPKVDRIWLRIPKLHVTAGLWHTLSISSLTAIPVAIMLPVCWYHQVQSEERLCSPSRYPYRSSSKSILPASTLNTSSCHSPSHVSAVHRLCKLSQLAQDRVLAATHQAMGSAAAIVPGHPLAPSARLNGTVICVVSTSA
jgi:hypothetical protein